MTDTRTKILGTVGEALTLLLEKDRPGYKGEAISKLTFIERRSAGEFEVEIVRMVAIPRGVEVYIKAWKDNDQIGFGRDGTVEIERMRIINPPILIPDGSTLIEDLEGALLQSLGHSLSVKKEIHDASKIVPGKTGMTTTTIYPEAGSGGGNTTCDGFAERGSDAGSLNELFGTIHAGAGNNHATGDFSGGPLLRSSTTSPRYDYLRRWGQTYDTSPIGTDTVTSVTLSLYYNGKSNGLGEPDIDVVAWTPAADNDIADSDYAQFGSTAFGTITYANWTAAQYNDFSLSQAGINTIDGSGVTGFGQRLSWDTDLSFTGTWASAATTDITSLTAEINGAGTTQDPKIVVEHEAASGVAAGLASNLLTLGAG